MIVGEVINYNESDFVVASVIPYEGETYYLLIKHETESIDSIEESKYATLENEGGREGLLFVEDDILINELNKIITLKLKKTLQE